MNRLSKCLILILFLSPLFIAAQNSVLPYIPNDAQNIYVFNMKSIGQKMDIAAIREMDFFKKLMNEAEGKDNKNIAYLKNPAESGIHFDQQAVLTMSALEGSMRQMITFIVPIADKEKFEKMLGSLANVNIKRDNDVASLETDSSLTVWNSKVLIYKTLSKDKLPKGFGNMGNTPDDVMALEPDSTMLTELDSTMLAELDTTMITELDTTMLAELDTTMLTEPDTMAMAAIDPFIAEPEIESFKHFFPTAIECLKIGEENDRVKSVKGIMTQDHDIYIYQTSDGATKNPMSVIGAAMIGIEPKDFEGNNTYGWCDFEKGRIYSETKMVINDALKAKFADIVNPKPAVNWNKYITLDADYKPMMVMALSLNPKGLAKMMEENPMLKGGADAAAKKSKKKIEFKEILDQLGGDIFATIGADKQGGMQILAGINIKDEKKAMRYLERELKVKEVAKYLYTIPQKEGAKNLSKEATYILVRDKIIFIGNESKIKAMAETPSVLQDLKPIKVTQPWQNALQNKTFNMFFDINSVMALAPKKNDSDNIIMSSMPIESMRITMGGGQSEFELKMKNDNENALKAFFTWIDTIASSKKEKESKD